MLRRQTAQKYPSPQTASVNVQCYPCSLARCPFKACAELMHRSSEYCRSSLRVHIMRGRKLIFFAGSVHLIATSVICMRNMYDLYRNCMVSVAFIGDYFSCVINRLCNKASGTQLMEQPPGCQSQRRQPVISDSTNYRLPVYTTDLDIQ